MELLVNRFNDSWIINIIEWAIYRIHETIHRVQETIDRTNESIAIFDVYLIRDQNYR